MDLAEATVGAFFRSAEKLAPAYVDAFHYFAVRRADQLVLLQGRLFRHSASELPGDFSATVETETVIAGRFRLSEVGVSAEELVRAAMQGHVAVPNRSLRFPASAAGFQTSREPFHEEGLRQFNRWDVLHVHGAELDPPFDPSAVDWQLRALSKPYESVQELLIEYSLHPLRPVCNLDVAAFNVAWFDLESTITGTKARLQMRVALGLSREDASLGYRSIVQGKVVERGRLSGTDFKWEQVGTIFRGEAEIEVAPAAVLQCFASYAGSVQHFGWVGDPANFQNSRRAAFAISDPNLEVLRDYALVESKRRVARDLEPGIAWLLWLHGFSVAHLGAMPKTQDFADLIAATPIGHLAVVECTTGLLKADNKLPNLIDRTERVRRTLIASGHSHLHVLPVLVTTKTREEVKADLDQAIRLGVLVLTRHEIEGLINRTLLMANAEQLFADGQAAVKAAQEKLDLAAHAGRRGGPSD